MPNTPSVTFNFINKNVESTTPQLGVSHVVARTTKGDFNKPDEVISNITRFRALYGEEIVPDGSISNIQKAFEMGSKLRVSRVAGGDSPSKPTTTWNEGSDEGSGKTSIFFGSKSKNCFIEVTLTDKRYASLNYTLTLKHDENSTSKWSLQTSEENGGRAIAMLNGNDSYLFQNFLNSLDNLEVVVKSITCSSVDASHIVPSVDNLIWFISEGYIDGIYDSSKSNPLSADITANVSGGSDGGDSTEGTWKEAFDALTDYNDAYAIVLSHVHQHIPNDYTKVYKYAADVVKKAMDVELYVEVPKANTQGELKTVEETLTELISLRTSIGTDKSIAYFGGGIKYYNSRGVIQNCDVLGTVLGLGDTSASNNGPWYSFAGMNRGIVGDALGACFGNLGVPSKIDVLQQFAELGMNLFVIKDTRTLGKRCMMWHSFTSHEGSDSYKFLSIMRLNLYVKKNLRPIIESYIEEPNIWTTWKNMYYEVSDIFSELVDKRAISEWTWYGDQDAQSYADLSVNTEKDVRAGKYHAIAKFKDIVTMQEITIDIVTDASTGDITFNTL